MGMLCEVLQEIHDVKRYQGLAQFLLIIGPIIFTLISLFAAVKGFNYFSQVTPAEESQARNLLQLLGAPSEGPFQLIESVSRLDGMENRHLASMTCIQELMKYFPSNVFQVYKEILEYMDLIPHNYISPERQTSIDKARIRRDIYNEEKLINDQEIENPLQLQINIQAPSLNYFPNLFRKIGEIPNVHRLKNGKCVKVERKDLDPESVAKRIFKFAGV